MKQHYAATARFTWGRPARRERCATAAARYMCVFTGEPYVAPTFAFLKLFYETQMMGWPAEKIKHPKHTHKFIWSLCSSNDDDDDDGCINIHINTLLHSRRRRATLAKSQKIDKI